MLRGFILTLSVEKCQLLKSKVVILLKKPINSGKKRTEYTINVGMSGLIVLAMLMIQVPIL